MIDPMISRLKEELGTLKDARQIVRRSPGSQRGKRALSYLKRESLLDDQSYFAYLVNHAMNKTEAKKLENEAKRLLSKISMKELTGSKAGRKSQYADAKEQALAGAEWLRT